MVSVEELDFWVSLLVCPPFSSQLPTITIMSCMGNLAIWSRSDADSTVANLPDSSLGPLNELGLTGIFFGFARVHPSLDTPLPTALPSALPSAHPSPSSGPSDRIKPIRHLSDLQARPEDSLLRVSSAKRGTHEPLDESKISSIPARTAPYPANSSPGMEGDEKRRLMAEDGKVWPMVMSVGYNPYFKNEKVTAVSQDTMHTLAGSLSWVCYREQD